MATKTFSSRADETALAFADALTQQEYGLSFGQYCGTLLLESIESAAKLPKLARKKVDRRKKRAAEIIKGFSKREHDASVAALDDVAIRDLIASRYE